MRILFVCKYNRFRSKIAEAFFNKLSKRSKAKSYGIFKGSQVSKNVIEVGKELGLKINPKPNKLTQNLLAQQDLIVIAADDVSKNKLKNYKKKIIIWKIPDVDNRSKEKIIKTIEVIEKKVKRLIRELE